MYRYVFSFGGERHQFNHKYLLKKGDQITLPSGTIVFVLSDSFNLKKTEVDALIEIVVTGEDTLTSNDDLIAKIQELINQGSDPAGGGEEPRG